MPERDQPTNVVELEAQSDQIPEKMSPNTLRLENYGKRMFDQQREFRKENRLDGNFIVGEN